ncbi:2-amino-3,7-dideoxy-D-threo-hept-6-ulosonate synthase [Kitasatospora sp. LaBMicrA B282]|uniref:2-amino-3,7-dideoxy-D-threo-hept-6-ulosonate synthase n=1 Tax=Kitasatospora sp. LaBMicrA B282 TaxID=3420949 RepID=UPI003D142BCC
MPTHHSFARRLRLQRLHHHDEERLFVVPLDHSVTDGPIASGSSLDLLVGRLATNGVDAVVVHKGVLAHVDPQWFTRTSLIVHLSASTRHAPDPDAKYLVATVEEALRLGADAVSVHVNLGSAQEREQVADLARVAEACDRWNLPLMAMMYPRGPKIGNPQDPELVAHAARLAAELGADVVKAPYVGSAAEMADVVRACPVPVIVVGGPRRDDGDAVVAFVEDALRGGAAGVAMGRNVFEAADPGEMARRLSAVIHRDLGMAVAGSALEVSGSELG